MKMREKIQCNTEELWKNQIFKLNEFQESVGGVPKWWQYKSKLKLCLMVDSMVLYYICFPRGELYLDERRVKC